MNYSKITTKCDIKQAILDIIKEVYCKEYTSKLIIKELLDEDKNVIGYNLTLGLNNIDKPLTINKEGTIPEFLDFIKQELRSRSLHHVNYSLGYKVCN